MAIGDKLKELMDVKQTNPNQLSINSGVNVNTIYGIIRRNNKKVNLDDLMAICDALNVSINYFADSDLQDESSRINPVSADADSRKFPPDKNFSFSPSEQQHIKKYRALDKRGKEMVDLILNDQYNRYADAPSDGMTLAAARGGGIIPVRQSDVDAATAEHIEAPEDPDL
ncbi:MAG: helix-turn-helix transcriptional regulator [Oscillospiraceae bacterium]|nr:helix-turn-helix transcriptional regulator [Oscillospiraceae bacterium]